MGMDPLFNFSLIFTSIELRRRAILTLTRTSNAFFLLGFTSLHRHIPHLSASTCSDGLFWEEQVPSPVRAAAWRS